MPGAKRARTEGTLTRHPITGFAYRWQRGKPRSRGRARNKGVMVPRNKLGFPQSMRTKLRFCTNVRYDLASATTEVLTIRANSVFDPEHATGAGQHQPRGTAQYFELYETYTVLGSTCAVNFAYQGYNGPANTVTGGVPTEIHQGEGTVSTVPSGVPPVVCLIQKSSDEVNNITTVSTMMEQDKTIWKVLTNTGEAKSLKASLKVSDFFGTGKLVGAAGFTGTAATNPDEEVFFHIGAARMNNNQPNAICFAYAIVTVEYDVVFTEPKKLPQSA